MSPRPAAAYNTEKTNIGKTKPHTTTSSSAMAYRGVLLKIVRQGTPLQVIQMLEQLRASHDVELGEDDGFTDVALDDLDPNLDAEIDLRDEDSPDGEEWADDGPDQEEDAMLGAPSDDRYALVVQDGACRLSVDGRLLYRPRTPLEQQVMYELDLRLRTLARIAVWLTDKRSRFLQTRDIWDLGCDALRELSEGRPAVVQRHFLRNLTETKGLSEASLSRYVRASNLVWYDGSGELGVLFGDSARRAWVANAVKQFVESRGEVVTSEMLNEYASAKVARSRGGRNRMLQRRVERMDLPSLIATANLLAGTKWSDVIDEYRNRLMG